MGKRQRNKVSAPDKDTGEGNWGIGGMKCALMRHGVHYKTKTPNHEYFCSHDVYIK